MKHAFKAASICALVICAVVALSATRIRSALAFKAAFEKLSLGMTFKAVSALIGTPADYEYGLGTFRIYYWRSPRLYSCTERVKPDLSRGRVVTRLDDLPDLYGYVQVAFDSNDTLRAYTFIGEAYTVEAASGSVRGSHLSKLGSLTANQVPP